MLYHLAQEVITLAKADRKARLQLILAALVGTLTLLYGLASLWGMLFPRAGRTYPVQGSVTFQGTPLESGEITFEPGPGEGQIRTAMIADGRFALPAEEGLPRGTSYTVRVRGYRKTGQKYENADMSLSAEISEQFLPSRYNSESELTFESTAAGLRAGLILRLE